MPLNRVPARTVLELGSKPNELMLGPGGLMNG